MARQNIFHLPEDDYTPYILTSKYSRAQVQAEYSRLRDIIQKRLKRMEKAGPRFQKTEWYQENRANFPKVKFLMSDNELIHKTAEMYQALSSSRSSITGIKKFEDSTIERLHKHGYNFVNRDNLHEFGQYMEFMRRRNQGRAFDSDQTAKTYNTAANKNVSAASLKRSFNYWKEHEQDLEKLPTILTKRGKATRNADQYKKVIKHFEESGKRMTRSSVSKYLKSQGIRYSY